MTGRPPMGIGSPRCEFDDREMEWVPKGYWICRETSEHPNDQAHIVRVAMPKKKPDAVTRP